MINRDTRKIIYLDKWINDGKQNSLTLDNTNVKAYKDGISLSVSNIFRCKYRSVIDANIIIAELHESWFYRPKLVSWELYKSMDFWHVILWMNNMVSITEFNRKQIQIFNPNKWSLVTSIINREEEYLKDISKNPQVAISTPRTYRRG